jgi:hypothetical protein
MAKLKSYAPKTDEEIKALAEDLYRGRIFTDRHIRNGDKMATSVFMPIAFFDEKTLKSLREAKIGLFYEYMDKACPVSVNGYPTFGSVRMLSQDDTKRLFELHDKIKSAVENVVNAEKKEERKEK